MTSGERHILHLLGDLMDESRRLLLAESEPGLRPSHHRVIGHVAPGGTTVTELAGAVGMTKQGIGQFVTQLTDSGHLSVARDPGDARVRIVRRTRKGTASVRRLERLLVGLEATWAERVGAERYEGFRAVLAELAPGNPSA